MRTRFAAGFVFAACALNVIAADKKDKRRAALIYKPRIDYPLAARRAGITGSGVVAVDVDYKTGLVTRAYMLKSTGSQLLDDAAMTAFRRAKFAGDFKSPVKIPIQFGGGSPRSR